jgi:Flp pilus assembly protein TadG
VSLLQPWRRLGRRGNIAVMTALLGVPLAGFVGLATDGARAWVLQSRLYTALDAAALAMARNVGVPAATRDAEAAGMFWANFGVNPAQGQSQAAAIGGTRRAFMGSDAVFDPPVQLDSGTIRVSATAAIPAYFTRLLGFTELRARAVSEARRADLGLELALVLDVTGSMDTGCSTPSNRTGPNCGFTPVPRQPNQVVNGRNSNIDLLRLAAADLVNVLYGDRETVPNLWVSMVPYTTTFNIGPNRVDWLDPSARATLTADFSPTTWRGCVEARRGYPGAPADGDLMDYSPAEAPFRPFLYRSTLGDYTLNGNPVPGDNDWARLLWTTNTVGQNAITEDFQLWRGNSQVGPNVGCPRARVLPLTASKTTVLNAIEALEPSFRGGTMGNLGLLGGWFTLSPRWRAAWNLGSAPPGQTTALPLDYNTRFMRKAVVMMTDGDNQWFDSPTGFPGSCSGGVNTASFPTVATTNPPGPPGPAQHVFPVACPPGNQTGNVRLRPGAAPIANNADYTGYGRRSDNRATPADMNARFAQLCTTMKNQGIIIYTVVLNTAGTVNQGTRDLYQACASVPANYFFVSQPNQLRPAFQQIGQQLANLRLVQ